LLKSVEYSSIIIGYYIENNYPNSTENYIVKAEVKNQKKDIEYFSIIDDEIYYKIFDN